MVVGGIVGTILHQFSGNAFINEYFINGAFHVGGKWFVNALKMLMVPLVFVSIVCGVCSLADPKKLGNLSLKTIGLYLVTTALALVLAISLALIFQPGEGMPLKDTGYVAKESVPFVNVLVNLIPSNVVQAFAEAKMLQIIIFAILFAIAIMHSGKAGERIKEFFDSLNEVVLAIVNIIMKFAPYGVFCLIAKTFATFDTESLFQGLFWYFALVVLALILHALITYSALLRFVGGLNPIVFFKGMWPAMITAFGTSSSAATLPVTMRCVEKNIGVKKSTYSFTLPLGATINMDGTAIMQGIATLFIAQAYGEALTAAQLGMIVVTATLASIGTAAVPGVGLIMLQGVLLQVGLPIEAIGMILGIDRLLDMTRTAVNISGDAAVSAIVAKSEGEIDLDVYNDPVIHSNFEDPEPEKK